MANTPFAGMESYINHGHDVVEEGCKCKSRNKHSDIKATKSLCEDACDCEMPTTECGCAG